MASKMKTNLIDTKPVSSNEVAAISMVDQLAAFVVGTKYEALSETAIHQAKIRILDALACAIGALDGVGVDGRGGFGRPQLAPSS